jgi:signal transduction histidine kinase
MTFAGVARTKWVVLISIILWILIAWFITRYHYQNNVADLIQRETGITQDRTQDLTDSIRRNLKYISGSPKLFSHQVRIIKSVSIYGKSTANTNLTFLQKQKIWTDKRFLIDVDRYLATAKNIFEVDLFYVLNSIGDCVAASNWDETDSAIGVNLFERSYFKLNMNGQNGMQYAVGKITLKPGLYFSSPIMVNGKFMGAAVAKIDLAKLSFLITQIDAYIADTNGVIILAHDKNKEFFSIQNAPVHNIPKADLLAKYHKDNFPELKILTWGNDAFPELKKIPGEQLPFIVASKALPEFGLTVYVENRLDTFPHLKSNAIWFGVLLSSLGIVLILSVGAAKIYIRSIEQARLIAQKSVVRLNRAEVASISGNWEYHIVTDEYFFSQGMGNLFGLPQSELNRDSFKRFILPEFLDMRNNALNELIKQGKPYDIKIRIKRADTGEIRDIRSAATFDKQSGVIFGIARDITQQQKLEKIKSEFISIVSHELRTPLTSIRGALGLVLGLFSTDMPEKAQELLKMANSNSERLTLLINDLLDLEKIDSGKFTLDLQKLNVAKLTRQAIEANNGYASEYKVHLQLLEVPEHINVYADEHRMMQVFANLLSNAIKYSPQDGSVEINVHEKESRIRISVRDFGQGIPTSFYPSIFQRFSQADSSSTRSKGGTGLGLSITKAIIEQHHGSIDFASEEGVGTEFYFDLPICLEAV